MDAFLGAAGRLGEDPASFLDAGGKVLAEYIWLGCTGSDLRNKTRVLDAKPEAPEDCPVIVVDANPLGLAGIEDTEVYLKPRKIFRDPFRGGDHILVLCDTFQPPQVALDRPDAVHPTLQPHPSNTRAACDHVVRQAQSADPMFAVEQEYVVEGSGKDNASDAFGFATGAELSIPGAAFLPGSAISALNRCVRPSAATRAAAARQMSDAHLRQCLYAGVNIRGATQLSSAAGIWSYKVGPCRGVDVADQLWMSRYLLLRLSEQQGLGVSFEPSLKDGSSCTGCCVKYSTEATRDPECGLGVIQEHIARLEGAHLQHVVVYGRGTLQRLVSNNLSHFAYAIGSKPACITIPTTTVLNRSGYYVDRRPSSNMDPYVVTMLLVATTEDIPVPVMGLAHQQQQHHQQQQCSMQTAYPASAPQQSSASCFKNNQRCSAPVPTGSNPFGAKAAARQIAAFGAPRGSFSHLSSYHGVAGSPLEAGVLCGAVNASWCSAPRPTCSYNTGATSGVTMNTEDVLLDELDRIDGFAPDTPPNNQFSLTSACASSDECCSDGTSPERPCPLLQVGSVPMQYELLW